MSITCVDMSTPTNPLTTLRPTSWIGDGTVGATFSLKKESSSSSTTIITFGSPKRGTPFNVRLDDPNNCLKPTDNLYFEVTLVGPEPPTGTLAVGFVKSTEFLPGWKTRGMFYNGNITNGSALKISNFGNRLTTIGDKLGVYLLRTDSDSNEVNDTKKRSRSDEEETTRTKVIFYINGRCLGVGFDIVTTTTSKNDNIFYPCLHLDGKATIKYTAPSSFPSTIDRHSTKKRNTSSDDDDDDPYSGDWILKEVSDAATELLHLVKLPIPDGYKIILSFVKVAAAMKMESTSSPSSSFLSTYRLSIKVGNTFNTTIKIIERRIDKDDEDEKIDKIQVIGPTMSTRMKTPSLELQRIETFLNQQLDKLKELSVYYDDNDNENGLVEMLEMFGPHTKLEAMRYEKSFEPVTSYD